MASEKALDRVEKLSTIRLRHEEPRPPVTAGASGTGRCHQNSQRLNFAATIIVACAVRAHREALTALAYPSSNATASGRRRAGSGSCSSSADADSGPRSSSGPSLKPVAAHGRPGALAGTAAPFCRHRRGQHAEAPAPRHFKEAHHQSPLRLRLHAPRPHVHPSGSRGGTVGALRAPRRSASERRPAEFPPSSPHGGRATRWECSPSRRSSYYGIPGFAAGCAGDGRRSSSSR